MSILKSAYKAILYTYPLVFTLCLVIGVGVLPVAAQPYDIRPTSIDTSRGITVPQTDASSATPRILSFDMYNHYHRCGLHIEAWAVVTDTEGLGDIDRVTVTDSEGRVGVLEYEPQNNRFRGFVWQGFPFDAALGEARIDVVDRAGNVASVTKTIGTTVNSHARPIYPAEGSVINEAQPLLQWEPVPEAVEYRVQIFRFDTNDFIWSQEAITETSTLFNNDGTATQSLLERVPYRYEINATDVNGNESLFRSLFGFSNSGPQKVYVDVQSSPAPFPLGSAENPYRSLRNGIVNALPGDTVLVLPGIYEVGELDFGSIVLEGTDPATTIIQNHAIHVVFDQTTISGLWFRRSPEHAGISVFPGVNATIENSIISDNVVDGIHLACTGPSFVTATNNVIVNNRIGISSSPTPSTIDARNNIFFNNESAINGSFLTRVTASHNAFFPSGSALGANNVLTDPLFADASRGNFRLLPGSPAIDAGDPSPEFLDVDGSRNDMGIYGGPKGGFPVIPYPPRVGLNTSAIDFGETVIGTSSEIDVVITNVGDLDLNLDDLAISINGDSDNVFDIIGDGSGVTVGGGGNASISVSFSPVFSGQHQASLRIINNTSLMTNVISLTGIGTAPQTSLVPVERPNEGEQLRMNLDIQSETFTPTTQRIYYRRAGEVDYQTTDFFVSNDSLIAVIPSDYVTTRGIQYYIELGTDMVTVTEPAVTPESNPFSLRVDFPNFAVPLSMTPEIPTMITLPINLADSTVRGVLGDDYGEQYDFLSWRIFRWNATTEAYDEVPDNTFQPGMAYWLITREARSFDVEGGRSVALQPVDMILQSGWNQIGNPFAFPIDWALIEGSESVGAPVHFDGSSYAYLQTSLQPWTGYFVENPSSDPVLLTISPDHALTSAGKRVASRSNPGETASYTIQVIASLPEAGLIDAQNRLGFAEGAENGRDKLDYAEAPILGNHVRLSTIEQNQRFAGNFKPVTTEGNAWDLEVQVVRPLDRFRTREQVEVQLVEHGERPADFETFVFDEDRQHMIVVRDGRFSIPIDESFPISRLRLIAGTRAYAEGLTDIPFLPATTELLPNFPNPFNTQTTIDYQLSEDTPVEISIYDILGKRVALLIDESQEAGVYRHAWDGRDMAGRELPSGQYFYRLRAGFLVRARSMTLVR